MTGKAGTTRRLALPRDLTIFTVLTMLRDAGGELPAEHLYDQAALHVPPGEAYRYYMDTVERVRDYRHRKGDRHPGPRRLQPEEERARRGRRLIVQDSIRGAIGRGVLVRVYRDGVMHIAITEKGRQRLRVSGISA